MSLPHGQVSAIFRAAGGTERFKVGESTVELTAPGAVTGGQFGLFRWTMVPRAGGAAPHFHRTFSESFYVLSGQVGLSNGREWVSAAPGDFLFVPAGGIHGFRNDADEPAQMLILFAPGPPRERYFRELAERIASGRTFDPAETADFLARHDQYMVEEPEPEPEP